MVNTRYITLHKPYQQEYNYIVPNNQCGNPNNQLFKKWYWYSAETQAVFFPLKKFANTTQTQPSKAQNVGQGPAILPHPRHI